MRDGKSRKLVGGAGALTLLLILPSFFFDKKCGRNQHSRIEVAKEEGMSAEVLKFLREVKC